MERSNWMMVAVLAVGLTAWLAGDVRAQEKPAAAKPDEPKPVSPQGEVPPGPFAGRLRLALPPKLYVVAGHETNVYFDNVVLALRPERYAYDVLCAKGKQQEERWTWTPGEADVGVHAWSLEVRDEQNQIVARGEMPVEVVAAGAAAGRELSVLMIGDSLTHASAYPAHVLARSREPNGPKLTLVGSHQPMGQPAEVRHEGYGGWTAQRFATHFLPLAREGEPRLRGSPFLYAEPDGAKKLDFARYVRDVCGGRAPDYVTFFLGPNDVFSQKDDTIDATVDAMLGHLDALFAAVEAGAPQARIGLLLPVPPAATQDAFGSNYGSGQTRWQYKRNQHRTLERMLEKYGAASERRVTLVPTHVNLDCVRNYPTESVPANAQADPNTKIVRLSNGVHPAASGYRQTGDTLYAWLIAAAAGRASGK